LSGASDAGVTRRLRTVQRMPVHWWTALVRGQPHLGDDDGGGDDASCSPYRLVRALGKIQGDLLQLNGC
jgi:hypothetical protein